MIKKLHSGNWIWNCPLQRSDHFDKEIKENHFKQSGTKPNLVDKIWWPNLVTICAWLPKLVGNVSSQFHHRARFWFSCQMATNNGSPHLQIRHNLSGLYHDNWKWLHPIVIAFNTLCSVKFYIQSNGVWHFTKLIGAHTFFPCLRSWFSQNATTVGSPPNI